MAYWLSDYVLSGEIFNTTNYSVHGWLELRGWDHPLVLQLTGNCSPDLAGWHFRFEARGTSGDASGGLEGLDVDALATQQIGPTGTMTAAPRIRKADFLEGGCGQSCSRRHPAPPGKHCLHLEWSGQNGRVVVELVDPVLEFVEFQDLNARGKGPAAVLPVEPELPDQAAGSPCDAALPEVEDEGEFDDLLCGLEEEEEEEEDPYGLFPRDLQLQLDLGNPETDWSSLEDEDKPQVIRELELMDELIENSPGVPLSELFDNPVKCPLPDQLDDEQVEAALKSLLAELARFGVALEICEHFTLRDAYQLLLEQICPEERAYPELRNTQWVQHHSTSDYCDQCQAEFEQELDDYDRRLPERPEDETGDWDDPDDGIPF